MTTRLAVAAERSIAVSLVPAFGIVALIHGGSMGAPLTVAAVAVLAALIARIGVLRAASNRRAPARNGDRSPFPAARGSRSFGAVHREPR